MKYYPAHIRIQENGERLVQTCRDHCRNTAVYSEFALNEVGMGNSGYLVGLLHDMGKFKDEFEDYLSKSVNGSKNPSQVNHTFAAVRFLLERYHNRSSYDNFEYKDIVSELLAYSVGAHHGLFDCCGEHTKGGGFLNRLEKPGIYYEESSEAFLEQCVNIEEIDALFAAAEKELEGKLEICGEITKYDDEVFFYVGMLARLMLSAVLEGDRRDTAEFMGNFHFPSIVKDRSKLWSNILASIEEKLKKLPIDTPLQEARRTISEKCRVMAEKPGGIYRLNVPTGAGKTLSGLRFAVAHAKRWNKRRIIFIAPLLSILDQNALVIREYVQNDSLILEHHSNIIRDNSPSESLDTMELLEENWDAPIVITTMVQFLNTLFLGKTSCIRRMWALCNSVIVIDEVQTVPNNMLTLFNLAINFLERICGATVVLCSATQPCLEATKHSLLEVPKDLFPHDRTLWDIFKRTNIIDSGLRRLNEIGDFAESTLTETDSLLIICNKKAQALELFHRLQSVEARCFHLSASMCVAHRRQVLDEIKQSLDIPGKTVCVATQVIEAGVDISFGRVIRFAAGMDSVVQAAGRCNRNGESSEPAPVYLIRCANESLTALPEIKRGKDASIELLSEFPKRAEHFENDLSSNGSIGYYYRRLYASMDERYQDLVISEGRTIFSLLSDNLRYANDESTHSHKFFLRQAFAIAGSQFKVFDSSTVDLLVPYGKGKEIIVELCSERAIRNITYMSSLLEQAKHYTISIFDAQRKQLERLGALVCLCENRVLALREEFYDEKTGLCFSNQEREEVTECDILIL